MPDPGAPVRVWRVSPVLRIAFTTLGVVILVTAAFVPSLDPAEPVVYRGLMAVFAVACCVVPHYLRVELHSDHVLLRGIARKRTVDLTEVASVEADADAMVLVHHDGRLVVMPPGVGERSPIASWLGRRTRSDAMVEEIQRAVRRRS